MLEHKTILNKIEKLVDQLPYRTAEIRIELPKEILVLTKERQPKPGFDTPGASKYLLTEATVSVLEMVAFFIPF